MIACVNGVTGRAVADYNVDEDQLEEAEEKTEAQGQGNVRKAIIALMLGE